MLDTNEQQFEMLENRLNAGDMEAFREELLSLHPYDQAMFFSGQPEERRLAIYKILSPDHVAAMMEHIDFDEIEPYFTEMNPPYAAAVLADMATDDAVDIMKLMDKDKVVSFLTIMDQTEADEIKHLLHYEEKTAGSIMTTEFVAIDQHKTVKQTLQQLKREAPDAETIYYLYVVDGDRHLVGVASLRDLIIAEDETLVGDIMGENVVNVSVAIDQEEVAQMFRDYNFLALPVVDFQKHLLGIITVDDILDVMEEEANEDYSKFAAVGDQEKPEDSPFKAAKKRLPWLIILLFLGMMTASLIGMFEETIEKVAILAIFIPVIAGMSGNTGTQSLAVAVRGLATGDYGTGGRLKFMLKEAGTGLITGSVCGLVIFVLIFIWKGTFFLGLLVGFAILVTLTIATLSGSLIPILMDKMKVDPAVASGPFITTINDLISVSIYFGLATAFMKYLV